MRGPAEGWPEQTAADAATACNTVRRSPAYAGWEGRPEAGPSRRQGGSWGAKPPGLGGPGGYPPGSTQLPSGLELVAQASDGQDVRRVRRVGLDLRPQPLDVDVERLG